MGSKRTVFCLVGDKKRESYKSPCPGEMGPAGKLDTSKGALVENGG